MGDYHMNNIYHSKAIISPFSIQNNMSKNADMYRGILAEIAFLVHCSMLKVYKSSELLCIFLTTLHYTSKLFVA